ncbi:MAG: hypothetical protein JKY62_05825 [Desulfocapsa sp.]|nr:hypothetical protein [Desulfocapsa sp.]
MLQHKGTGCVTTTIHIFTGPVSTADNFHSDGLAAGIFSRWCQENFFLDMIRHFTIELIAEDRFGESRNGHRWNLTWNRGTNSK